MRQTTNRKRKNRDELDQEILQQDQNVARQEDEHNEYQNYQDIDNNQREPAFTVTRRKVRVYKKNAAVDTTYRISFNDNWQGSKLKDLLADLTNMFQTVLKDIKTQYDRTDLGRVVLYHPNLAVPIVVSLRPLADLTASAIMDVVVRTLNSNEQLDVREGFDIDIGVIRIPKGTGSTDKIHIREYGDIERAVHLKRSLIQVVNNDNLCLVYAICLSWGKLYNTESKQWLQVENKLKKDRIAEHDIALSYQKLSNKYFKRLCDKRSPCLKLFALALCERTGVNSNNVLTLNDIPIFEKYLNVGIAVISGDIGDKFLRIPDSNNVNPKIYLYHYTKNDGIGHFDAISKISGFFTEPYFCETCMIPFYDKRQHKCKNMCNVCYSLKCEETNSTIVCGECNRTCRGRACYDRHKEIPTNRFKKKALQKSACNRWYKCLECTKVISTSVTPKEMHSCGDWFCHNCKVMANTYTSHMCYYRCEAKSPSDVFKYMMFDYECRQDSITQCETGYESSSQQMCSKCDKTYSCSACRLCSNCKDPTCGEKIHIPNFVVAQKVCNLCREYDVNEGCKNCGNRCKACDKFDVLNNEYVKTPCNNGICGSRIKVCSGDNTLQDFGDYVFSKQHKNMKILAHNLKAYDGFFLTNYLFRKGLYPSNIVYNGSKIMYMEVKYRLNITVLDSLNYLPLKLSALPKTLGLPEIQKGNFPHLFNTLGNQQYEGVYPGKEMYGYECMTETERKTFDVWYESVKNDTFIFREQIERYCMADVTILREACMKFRDLIIQITKSKDDYGNETFLDPFNYVTIASVCMGMFRTTFLQEEHKCKLKNVVTGIIKEGVTGFYKNGCWRFPSEPNISIGKNDWELESTHFIRSPIALVPPGGYQRDQFSKISLQWLAWMEKEYGLEIQHALNYGEFRVPFSKYKLDGYVPPQNGQRPIALEFHSCIFHGHFCTPDVKLPKTNQTKEELYALTMKKKRFLEQNGFHYICKWECEFKKEIERNAELRNFIATLDFQDRLNPRDALFGGRTEVCRLFYEVKEGEKMIYYDFTSLYPYTCKYCAYPISYPEVIVNPADTNMRNYFGVALVKILPPKGLYHPVLPYRSKGKLKFPLCKTCADNENQKSKCCCSDEKRAIIGTWGTPEIWKALDKGYKVLRVYEVYYWKEWGSCENGKGIFTEYMNSVLKLKQESSGWPEWCKTESDRYSYIDQYLKKEGIKLEYPSIQKNPGKRHISKLFANCQWGKHIQRQDLQKSQYFSENEPEKFFSFLTKQNIEVTNFHIVNSKVIHVNYKPREGYIPHSNKTNIFIGIFTTMWARLHLYDLLEAMGENVCYMDTDSVIGIVKPGGFEPQLGDYLGELTNEIPSGYMTSFVSAGPKFYSYKTSEGKHVCKVKGFSLNFKNSQIINFDSIKEIVHAPEKKLVTVNPSKISRNHNKAIIYNKIERKVCSVVCTKRVILDDLNTLPYGF